MKRDNLIAQYENWIYPKPISDLVAYVAAGGHDLSDPARMRRKLWPRAIEPETLDILVAGCGANQAAIIAHANPGHRVIGIDLSGQAIASHMHLKTKHHLHNLELHQLGVEDTPALNRKFDLIVSTGVIHHLVDPVAGLTTLRQVLASHGVMSVMLYGQHSRAGVYMVQEAMRTLSVDRDPAGVAFARDTVGNLPSWHHAHSYLSHAPDLDYDAGFVDTILNARDRAYTVPEVIDLVQCAGLRFQGWLDGLYYAPSAAFPPEAKIHDRIYDLPREQQWHVVDLLTQVAGAHRFLVCHADRPDSDLEADFDGGNDWLDSVPAKHPDLRLTMIGNGEGLFEREWHKFGLGGETLAAIERVNGLLTFRQLLDGTAEAAREFTRLSFIQLIEWDHIFCEIRKAS